MEKEKDKIASGAGMIASGAGMIAGGAGMVAGGAGMVAGGAGMVAGGAEAIGRGAAGVARRQPSKYEDAAGLQEEAAAGLPGEADGGREAGPDCTGFPVKHVAPEWVEKSPLVHRGSRRSFSHDYCSPSRYHITATTAPGSLPLSLLPAVSQAHLKAGEVIAPILSELGIMVMKELEDINKFHPEMRVRKFVVMPDHIHFILHVEQRLKRMLGSELAGFFGACSKHQQRIAGLPDLKTLFQPFNDRIIYSREQLDKAERYIEDNPRRAIIKRQNGELFRRYLHLNIADHEYAAYGNIFLLRYYYLLPIRIHRRWSAAQFSEYEASCLREISAGAVPISPFIHPAEKRIRDKALAQGSAIIEITDSGIESRFTPQGERFRLCSEGRLLLLAPWQHNAGRRPKSGYTEFHDMNDMALAISKLQPDSRISIIGGC